ncbi:hypothetical protein N0V90_010557 [Kalmusia sp. IMI 367209]|nr:hypothetical protein N0V90_010557 [Kalmusia sp. IMI 367209]
MGQIIDNTDVFGPLAPCGNCEKTKKTCTFEWLRSQRVLQASAPQTSSLPPAKKRRTNCNPLQERREGSQKSDGPQAPQWTVTSDVGIGGTWSSQADPVNVGLTFADFPCGIPAFDDGLTPSFQYDYAPTEFLWNGTPMMDEITQRNHLEEQRDTAALDPDSGHGSSIHTASSEDVDGRTESSSPSIGTASRALNLAIFSFASQWAVPESKRKIRYPFHVDEHTGNFEESKATSNHANFDRPLQLTAWHQARKALNEAADIESFRVVLAHIVFSLTQKPTDTLEESKPKMAGEETSEAVEVKVEKDGDIEECEDLLSKLDLTMNDDGPPLHLEQGLRLIHSLRSRMTMTGAFGGRRKKKPRCWKHLQAAGLESADRATVDVLFWLGIMFDTLSSAMHKRPLVVSLEDSDLPAIKSIVREDGSAVEAIATSDPKAEDFWDDYLFRRQRKRRQRTAVRWPCSENQAASLLCEAAPIKVLLFRKVTRIQTLLSRHAPGEKIEAAVHSALEVYEHWQRMYAPLIRDCVDNHNDLPERVQSWYVCLAGHWHLATLLLADLIETMDETESGMESRRRERDSLNFISRFREENCRSLSDIARCACSQEDNILSQSRTGLFSIGQGALLSEPWSDVLVRAFATAGAILLEPAASPDASSLGQDDAFKRAEDCIKALRFLGARSDKALSAANILGGELKRRKEREYKLFPMLGSNEVACWG